MNEFDRFDHYISYEDAISRIRDTNFSLENMDSLKFYHQNILRQRAERSLSKCQYIDLTEVIRCKACKYRNTDQCKMDNTDREDFCSRAERKKIKEIHRNYRQVTKEEFDDFIKNFPRELDVHGIYFCTPPIIQYNAIPKDFDPYAESPYNYCEAYMREGYPGVSSDEYYIATDSYNGSNPCELLK